MSEVKKCWTGKVAGADWQGVRYVVARPYGIPGLPAGGDGHGMFIIGGFGLMMIVSDEGVTIIVWP